MVGARARIAAFVLFNLSRRNRVSNETSFAFFCTHAHTHTTHSMQSKLLAFLLRLLWFSTKTTTTKQPNTRHIEQTQVNTNTEQCSHFTTAYTFSGSQATMEVEAITVIYCGNSKYPGDCNYLKVSQTTSTRTEEWDGRTSDGKMAKVWMKDEIKRMAPNNFKIDDRKL